MNLFYYFIFYLFTLRFTTLFVCLYICSWKKKWKLKLWQCLVFSHTMLIYESRTFDTINPLFYIITSNSINNNNIMKHILTRNGPDRNQNSSNAFPDFSQVQMNRIEIRLQSLFKHTLIVHSWSLSLSAWSGCLDRRMTLIDLISHSCTSPVTLLWGKPDSINEGSLTFVFIWVKTISVAACGRKQWFPSGEESHW